LASIRQVFADKAVDRIPTAELIEGLRADEEAPWDDWHGRGLKPEGLAYLLRPYGIRARQMKVTGVNVRGFDLEQFGDSFSRYLPFPVNTPLARYPATSERESEHAGSKVAGETPVAGEGQNGSVAGDNGHLWHTCHGCHQPILELAEAFLDGATLTYWHRQHWQQRALA
jgi:hypothetical protein